MTEIPLIQLTDLKKTFQNEVMRLLDELHGDGATICLGTGDPFLARSATRRIAMLGDRVVDEEELGPL